jgi:hypothetical protein
LVTAHQDEASAYDSSYPEPTVKQIWKALELQHALQQMLDNPEAALALMHLALKPPLDQAATSSGERLKLGGMLDVTPSNPTTPVSVPPGWSTMLELNDIQSGVLRPRSTPYAGTSH